MNYAAKHTIFVLQSFVVYFCSLCSTYVVPQNYPYAQAVVYI